MEYFCRFRSYILNESRDNLTDGELMKIDEFITENIIYGLTLENFEKLTKDYNFKIKQLSLEKFQILEWPHVVKQLYLQVNRRNPRSWIYKSIFKYEIGDKECIFQVY